MNVGLVDRLLGTNADGSEPTEAPDRPHIPVHFFFSLINELDQGRLTVTQIKNGLNMNASEEAEFDALGALRPTAGTTAGLIARARWMSGLHATLMLADGRRRPTRAVPGYTTPNEVRLKLGLPQV